MSDIFLKHNHKVLNIGGGGPSTATLDHTIVVKVPRGYTAGQTIPAGQYTAEQLLAIVKSEFEVAELFTVTLPSEPANGGTTTGAGQYEGGTTIAISATPSTGYEFEKWSDGDTNQSRSITVNSNVTLKAMFKALPVPKAYITLAAQPSNGGTVSGAGEYPIGSTATISATPKTGYKFVKWDDNDTNASRTVTVQEAKTYTAMFEELPPEMVTVTAVASPTEGGTVTGGGSVAKGTSVTLTASPKAGYQFVKWTETGDTTASITFTANADVTRTAQFEPAGNFSAQGYTVTNKYDDEGEPTDEWYFTANGTKVTYGSEAEMLSALTTGIQLKNPRPSTAGGDDDCYIAFGVQGLPAGKTIICTNALGVNVAANPEKPTMQDGDVTIYVFRGSAGNAICTYHI